MRSKNIWHADLYDDKLNFVSNYGRDIVELLQPVNGERILDVGCGTGNLTFEISKVGADVVGIDSSIEMIVKAKEKFPELSFILENVESFRTNQKFDAVFSNAALHWMKQADKVVESIGQALNAGGRLVVEFGGKGNVQHLIQGIMNVLDDEYNIKAENRNPWYFPSIAEYSSLLEKKGFTVTYAHLFDRPTKLDGGRDGLNYWLESFADDFFPEFSTEERKAIFELIKSEVETDLFIDEEWIIDYKRLRIIAVKN